MTKQSINHRFNALSIDAVRRAMDRPLPGLSAQLRMVPSYREASLIDRTPPPAPKEASVLILIYPQRERLYFPLTRRTADVESHKGQVSLPGGAREPGESPEETALRETCEELSICADDWRTIGSLTPLYIPPSGYLITPFVAYVPSRPSFRPDPVEVAELIETPLDLLLNPTTVLREEWNISSTPAVVPFFHVFGHKVWGATAMVLSEFVTLLCEEPS